MLFTVVDSRDARLVAETADRRHKLTLEGTDVLRFPIGGVIRLDPPGVAEAAPAITVQAQVSGPAVSLIPDVEVTTDLSDEAVAVAPLAKKAKRQ